MFSLEFLFMSFKTIFILKAMLALLTKLINVFFGCMNMTRALNCNFLSKSFLSD